jgi:hypothetical protein
MRSSGAQRPAVAPLPQVASCAACALGTYAFGKQWAPAQVGLQPGKPAASITFGPVHGQVNVKGGWVGASHPSEHAPVGVVGEADVGS